MTMCWLMQLLCLSLLLSVALSSYDPKKAQAYADKFWRTPNHSCSSASYLSCSTWAYFGDEACGYPSHGGDCANFVSQCLVSAGHPPLVGYPDCRGYPCGKEEPGALNLDNCLANHFGWERVCGRLAKPPAWVSVGDVAVYHAASCQDFTAHATIVTNVNNSTHAVEISCHSPASHNVPYTTFFNTHPYISWLRKPSSKK